MKNRKKKFKDCNLRNLVQATILPACSIDFRLKTVNSTLIQISSLSTSQSAQSLATQAMGWWFPRRRGGTGLGPPCVPPSSCSSRAPRTPGWSPWSGCWKAWKRSIWHFWATSSPAGLTASEFSGPLLLSAVGRVTDTRKHT